MSKQVAILLLLTICFSFTGDDYTYVNRICRQPDFFTTDNQGNCYLAKNNILEKYNNKGELLKTYSNKQYGKISFIDASNPLRTLVFYGTFLHALFLDDMLAEKGETVGIERMGYPQTSLICNSFNNGFWLYDQQNMEVIQFNKNFQVTQRSGNLALITGTPLQPNFMKEYNNMLYLNNPQTGILVFDIFATYSKTIPLKRLKKFQLIDETIYYSEKPQELKSFNTKTIEENTITLPSEGNDVRIEKNTLYIKTDSCVSIYTIRQ